MKKILAVILVLVLAAGLTGCMYVEDSVVINEDGTGIMNTTKRPTPLNVKLLSATTAASSL